MDDTKKHELPETELNKLETGKLTSLDFSGRYWDDKELTTLSELLNKSTCLKEITFGNSNSQNVKRITDSLKQNTSINRLMLSVILDDALPLIASNLPSTLTELSLDGCSYPFLCDAVGPLTDFIAKSTSLKKLSISNMVVFENCMPLAIGLQDNSSITDLQLKIDYLSSERLHYFTLALYGKTALKSLNITGEEVSYKMEDVKNIITRLPHLTSLMYTECIKKENSTEFQKCSLQAENGRTLLQNFECRVSFINLRDAVRKQEFEYVTGHKLSNTILRGYESIDNMLKVYSKTEEEMECFSNYIARTTELLIISLSSSAIGVNKPKALQYDESQQEFPYFIVLLKDDVEKLVKKLELDKQTTEHLFSI